MAEIEVMLKRKGVGALLLEPEGEMEQWVPRSLITDAPLDEDMPDGTVLTLNIRSWKLRELEWDYDEA